MFASELDRHCESLDHGDGGRGPAPPPSLHQPSDRPSPPAATFHYGLTFSQHVRCRVPECHRVIRTDMTAREPSRPPCESSKHTHAPQRRQYPTCLFTTAHSLTQTGSNYFHLVKMRNVGAADQAGLRLHSLFSDGNGGICPLSCAATPSCGLRPVSSRGGGGSPAIINNSIATPRLMERGVTPDHALRHVTLIYINIHQISAQTHKRGGGTRFPDDRVMAHHEQP